MARGSGDDGDGGDKRRRRRRSAPSNALVSDRASSLAVRVKTARGRKLASTQWLQRQLNDPYVQRAKAEGYRSRAAFKLIELDEKFQLLKRGAVVADLGAAPGGWCQVAVQRGATRVVGVDLLPMEPVAGAELLVGDFTDAEIVEAMRARLGGPAQLVMSDMAPNTTGHRETDHLRTVALVEASILFAEETLAPNGALIAKTFQGGAGADLVRRVKERFTQVRHAKPPASRPESPETYLIAQGFRGA